MFAAQRGFDSMLVPLFLSCQFPLPGGTSMPGWVLRSIGWDWSDSAEEARQKALCTGWNDRGQRCGGGRCQRSLRLAMSDVSLHGGRWGASSPGTIEDLI